MKPADAKFNVVADQMRNLFFDAYKKREQVFALANGYVRSWHDTCKKTPWTDKVVNIEKTEVENGDNSTPHKQVKRTRKSAK